MAAGKSKAAAALARHFRKFWRPFLTRPETERIARLCAEQSARSTGEIHVYVTKRATRRDMLEFAQKKFHDFGMDLLPHRNGVLIVIARWDRRFAIWGGEALHETAGQPLWDRAREALLAHFRARRFAQGIEACVREVGDELARRFPRL